VRSISTIVCTVVLVAQIAVAQTKTGIAHSWIAAWNSHDVERVVAIFTADVLYQDVTFGVANHGSAELRKIAASIFDAVPDAKVDLRNSWADRRHRSIEWIFSGTDHRLYKTGKRFTVRGVSVIDLRDRNIWRNLDYWDAASFMKQGRSVAAPENECNKIT
jgi:steroid delta-isomerase-like uncharacterized protein